jgi:multidrug efflux pump subunit AcrB
VVNLVKENIPKFQAVLPPGAKISYEFDQSPFVTRAIMGLTEEGLLGAVLTGLMVLLFLRDWRSALIVVVNIPLSIIAAMVALWASGQTVNLMTLGGLALAVGILVDEATVVIENVHSHLGRGASLSHASYDGTTETLVPNLLAMLSVLAVFISAFFMQGAAHNLFVPMALSVGFATVDGAASRLRPILMTSCAMIAGMLPMAIGFGEAGSQTAPLGRAVIGGLTGTDQRAKLPWRLRIPINPKQAFLLSKTPRSQ